MSKTAVIKQIIEQAKTEGAVSFESTIKGEKTPKLIKFRGSRNTYTPDVIVSYESKKDFFSIEENFNKADIPEMISRWILFSLEARKRKGKFYLMVPEKLNDSFEEIVNDKQISAEIRGY